ncbi:hypothetical protein A0H81_08582 [Grifola frondosa]|uniref:PAS fold-2 domain-containing protein n=1 Tax=Grifola frondosa TaxID=5627 RepID=A0A1C7M450_GRIFR|nr:hypothetical protein A0H81_08582 [Grifola frondosa]
MESSSSSPRDTVTAVSASRVDVASSSARGRANGNILAVQTEVVQGEVEVVQLPSQTCPDRFHLISGRLCWPQGKLTTCEDEPIRTPGAVQGFGILMAVEEDEETGNLVVRQVSENSTELLGLSPQYLFSLDCFSQTLPDPQGDVLFDNIQYLSDTSLTAEEQAENMHVFMLSGWGEPGSALLEDMNGDPQGRRSWNCWCAAHRPQMSGLNSTAGNGGSTAASSTGQDYNIIILEFELEKDSFNPLYPSIIPPEDSSVRSGVSSPSDASGSASNSSGRTLVSTSSEGDILPTPEGSPSLVNSNGSANVTATSSALSSQSSQAFNLPGRDDWLPSPEDILESTTSRSKPLLALERLRRTRRLIPESPSSPHHSDPVRVPEAITGGGAERVL